MSDDLINELIALLHVIRSEHAASPFAVPSAIAMQGQVVEEHLEAATGRSLDEHLARKHLAADRELTAAERQLLGLL